MAPTASLTLRDSISGTNYNPISQTPSNSITVNYPELANITVSPSTAKEGQTLSRVVVTYAVTDPILVDNTITIGLPTGWVPAYIPSGTPDATAAAFDTSPLDTEPKNTDVRDSTSYVVLTTSRLKSAIIPAVSDIIISNPGAAAGTAATVPVVVTGTLEADDKNQGCILQREG